MANPAIYNVGAASDTAQPTELRLNGWSVPVAMGKADLSVIEIGERARAASGMLAVSRIAQKKAGDFTTPWWDGESVRALTGLVQGRGDKWGFDANASAVYSAKGIYRNGGTGFGGWWRTSEQILSTNGTTLFENYVAHPKFGTGCLSLDAATRNQISTNSGNLANGTNAAGIASTDLVHFYQNQDPPSIDPSGQPIATPFGLFKAFKATWTGGQSLHFDPLSASFSASQVYCISLYLLSASGDTAAFAKLSYEGGADIYTQPVTMSTSRWTRVQLRTPALSGTGSLRLTLTTSNTATFYMTGIQAELSPVWHTWRGYAASNDAASSVAWNVTDLGPDDDLTISFWARKWDSTASAFVRLYQGNTGLFASWSSGTLSWGTVTNRATASLAAWAHWTHVALVQRQDPQTGSYAFEIWLDGTLAGHATGEAFEFDTSAAVVTLTLGAMDGVIDDLVFMPFGAPSDLIAAMADRTEAYPAPPYLDVTGDFLGRAKGISMLGRVGKTSSMQGRLAGQPFQAVYALPFSLEQE